MSAETITLFAPDGSQTNPDIDPEIERALRDAYQRVSKIPDFPKAACPDAAMHFLLKYGLEPERGYFLVDRMPSVNSRLELFRPHIWTPNSTKDAIYDLTLSQFNEYLLEPVPEGILVIEKDSPLYRRYFGPSNPLTDQLYLRRT